MTSHQFAFPPPPPPPPQTQPNHDKTIEPYNCWTNTRANRGDHRGGRGNWNRCTRAGSNGFFGGSGQNGYMQRNSGRFQNPSGSLPPTNQTASNYPLPEYPSVQQHQFSASTQYSYVHPVPTYPTASIAPTSSAVRAGAEFLHNMHRPIQLYSVQPQGTEYTYTVPDQNNSHHPQQPQLYAPGPPPPPESQNRPVLMGPPIRIGFDSNSYAAGDQRAQAHKPFSGSATLRQPDTRPVIQPSFRANRHNDLHSRRYESPNFYPNQNSRRIKREHEGSAARRILKVAPAVPSFGGSLPVKPPPPQENERIPKTKKRRHNQLGLTPKSLDRESSEEEDNYADEESKLAGAASLPDLGRQQIQFSYNGKISSLKSSADIAAWIEERKKRFPTKAKREEQMDRQRQIQPKRETARQALKESTKAKKAAKGREKQEAVLKENKHNMAKAGADSKEMEQESVLTAAATKSTLRLEKLRKKLEKEERRIAKAAAKASRLISEADGDREYRPGSSGSAITTQVLKRKRSTSGETENGAKAVEDAALKSELEDRHVSRVFTPPRQEENSFVKKAEIATDAGSIPNKGKALATTHNLLTPTSQSSPSDGVELHVDRNSQRSKTPGSTSPSASTHANAQLHSSPKDFIPFTFDALQVPSSPSLSVSSSLSSDSEVDSTSSSGSSSSSSSPAPESVSANRAQPRKVPPPNRHRPRQISTNYCHKFMQSGGVCPKGKRCRFRHDRNALPESARFRGKNNNGTDEQGRGQRISLYQRLVDQEIKQEQEQKKEAVIKKGEGL